MPDPRENALALGLDSDHPAHVLGRRKRRGETSAHVGRNAYPGLRTAALDAVARGLIEPSADHAEVSGIVVDVPSGGAFATIVALTDNTTSMYTSTGGGTLGAGEHAVVAAATHRLLAEVQRHLDQFADGDDQQLPPAGLVRLHVLTPTSTRRADVPEGAFWGREPHPLVPVIAQVQTVIAAIRTVSPDT